MKTMLVTLEKSSSKIIIKSMVRLISKLNADHVRLTTREVQQPKESSFNTHRSGILTALVWLMPHETAAISACSVYTIHHAKPHM